MGKSLEGQVDEWLSEEGKREAPLQMESSQVLLKA